MQKATSSNKPCLSQNSKQQKQWGQDLTLEKNISFNTQKTEKLVQLNLQPAICEKHWKKAAQSLTHSVMNEVISA